MDVDRSKCVGDAAMIYRLLARRSLVLMVLFVGLLAIALFVLGISTDGHFLTAETKSYIYR